MVKYPSRRRDGGCAFGPTLNVTVALPEPVAPVTIARCALALVATQLQRFGAVTCTVPLPPVASKNHSPEFTSVTQIDETSSEYATPLFAAPPCTDSPYKRPSPASTIAVGCTNICSNTCSTVGTPPGVI